MAIIIIMVKIIIELVIRFDSEKQMTKLCIYQEQELDVKAHYRKQNQAINSHDNEAIVGC